LIKPDNRIEGGIQPFDVTSAFKVNEVIVNGEKTQA
jgi:hypothetical protein